MTTTMMDGITVRRGLLWHQFVPWDDVSALEQRRLRLRAGTSVVVSEDIVNDARRALEGPVRHGSLRDDARALVEYVGGAWAPERTVSWLLDAAARAGASDLHFEPGVSSVDLRMRIAGELAPFATLPMAVAERLSAALKARGGCLPYRKDIVQEGRIGREGVTADVRASFIPTALGERIALRLFGRLLSLESLGLPESVLEPLGRALRAHSGLVLIAGPSGAGKTTTLYAALARLAAERRGAHLSLEDPVEQRLRVAGIPVDQVELCPERGLTGETALVAALRQDVDVLCVGEVRTSGEAQLAVRAAHTGRLVLAGLHAGSASEAVQRMKDLSVEVPLLKSTLVGVLHQRLQTVACPEHSGETCSRCAGVGRVRVVEAHWAEGER